MPDVYATIDGAPVNTSDPCALYQALYAWKLKVLSGGQVEEVEIRSPVTNRRTKLTPTDMAGLDEELRGLQRQCDAKCGRRTRYAAVGGFFRPY